MLYFSQNRDRRAIFVVILMAFLFCANQAHALSLSPARIEISGNPGEVIEKETTLTNESDTVTTIFYSSYSNFEASGESGNPTFEIGRAHV